MPDSPNDISAAPDPIPAIPPAPRRRESDTLHAIFSGPNGPRAGWRLLIFIAIMIALGGGGYLIGRAFHHGRRAQGMAFSAVGILIGEVSLFVLFLIGSWIMTKIEGRKIADYGLPAREAFGRKFWEGAAVGFLALTLLLCVLRAFGAFQFGMVGLHGAAAWKYAAIWGLGFLFVGFFEEFAFRGYMLFTLTTGVGFWPAALIMSALFAYGHASNPHENLLGVISTGAWGLLFCLALRRTGSLWFPIGMHAAWDWGQTYLYGVPDSGQIAPGHLLNSTFSGPAWLTGGTAGPEGSYLCYVLLFVVAAFIVVAYRDAKYPNPAAIPDPRRRAALPRTTLIATD
ncbi:MAG: lysostaphin resistance A-like protein [Candidatus Acidiferrales bacterium]